MGRSAWSWFRWIPRTSLPRRTKRSPGSRGLPRRSAVKRAGVAGLELRWTGDAVIGRDYMAQVQASLDRAAVATVVLLLIVLAAGLSLVLAGDGAAG